MNINNFKKICIFLLIILLVVTNISIGIRSNDSFIINESKGAILVYGTEDGTTNYYNKTVFDDDLPLILEDHGFSVLVTDRSEMSEITDEILENYQELWILSTNPFSPGCFSTDEISRIQNFREEGNGLLIMAEHSGSGFYYSVDANQIAIPLGVTFFGGTNHGPDGEPIYPDFEDHPLFIEVESLVGYSSESDMTIDGDVDLVATYNGDNLIAILDDGLGRVVFDVSFARLWDNNFEGGGITVGDTSQYVMNIADWLCPYVNTPPDIQIINPKEDYFHIFGIPLFQTRFNILGDTANIGGFRFKKILIETSDDFDENNNLTVKIFLNDEEFGEASYCEECDLFEMRWTGFSLGNYNLTVTATDSMDAMSSVSLLLWNLCIFP